MTKEEFLARCANAYDAGLITNDRVYLLEKWLDTVMRGGHSRLCDYRDVSTHRRGQTQWEYVREFWYGMGGEVGRLERNSQKQFGKESSMATLANDEDGYALIQFAAILRHPCQKCATDPKAWWTRPGFCTHRDKDQ